MEAGSVIASGTPAEVAKDPVVVASYLGGDPTAITRSGTGHGGHEHPVAGTKRVARSKGRA
jgi:hypothetical protein